jgi:hypothetical protein
MTLRRKFQLYPAADIQKILTKAETCVHLERRSCGVKKGTATVLRQCWRRNVTHRNDQKPHHKCIVTKPGMESVGL